MAISYVYLMAGYDRLFPYHRAYKIGVSKHPQKRLAEMQGNYAFVPFEILHTIQCDSQGMARKLEWQLHTRFAAQSLGREWFQLRYIQRVWIRTIESGALFLQGKDEDKWHFRQMLVATNSIAAGVTP